MFNIKRSCTIGKYLVVFGLNDCFPYFGFKKQGTLDVELNSVKIYDSKDFILGKEITTVYVFGEKREANTEIGKFIYRKGIRNTKRGSSKPYNDCSGFDILSYEANQTYPDKTSLAILGSFINSIIVNGGFCKGVDFENVVSNLITNANRLEMCFE